MRLLLRWQRRRRRAHRLHHCRNLRLRPQCGIRLLRLRLRHSAHLLSPCLLRHLLKHALRHCLCHALRQGLRHCCIRMLYPGGAWHLLHLHHLLLQLLSLGRNWRLLLLKAWRGYACRLVRPCGGRGHSELRLVPLAHHPNIGRGLNADGHHHERLCSAS